VATFLVIDPPDIGDDVIEIAFAAVLGVGFGRGAVDRNGQAAESVADEGIERIGMQEVEVCAVIGVQHDAALESRAHDFRQGGIEEQFAVVGKLDVLNGGVGVEEGGKVRQGQMAGAEGGASGTVSGGTGGAGELAVGRRVNLDGFGHFGGTAGTQGTANLLVCSNQLPYTIQKTVNRRITANDFC